MAKSTLNPCDQGVNHLESQRLILQKVVVEYGSCGCKCGCRHKKCLL